MHRWLLWTLLAILCWGLWALLGKLIGEALSPSLTQALSTIGLVPVMLLMVVSIKNQGNTNERSALPARRRGALVALGAGILACLGNVAYYGVLNRGAKAATVVALTALYPVVTVLLALLVLKERVNLIQICGIMLSLIAIYLF